MKQKRMNLGCGGVLFGWLFVIITCIVVFSMSIVNPKTGSNKKEEKIEQTKEESTEEKIEQTKEEKTEETTEEKTEETTEEKTEETVEEKEEYPQVSHGRMYLQLNDIEKNIYKVCYENIVNGKLEFKIDGVECSKEKLWEHVDSAYTALYYDYPEFFWLNTHRWDASANGVGNKYNIDFVAICHDYWNYVLNKENYINDVMSKANEIADEARTQETIYDKVKYVHDYLVTHVVYDEICLEEINQTVQRASNQQSHTAYGALVSNLAVCDGYAKAFQLIMNLLGIECEYIEGNAGEAHAWNYIKLDGENYWMDVTWDDYNLKNKDGSMLCTEGVTYDYYCITSENLYRTHEPDDTFAIPSCTATEYSFFYREGAYFEEYSFEGVCNAMNNQKDEQMISVQFATLGEHQEALDDIFGKKNRYFDIPHFSELEVQYIYSDKQYTITFIYPNN